MTKLYLKSKVKVEPLINDWYAWPMLISPITSAMITANLHVRLLDSFAKSPKLHGDAIKNRGLRGGMFMDYDGDVKKVENLLEKTRTEQASRIELAASIVKINDELEQSANGTCLDGFYDQLPDALRGYVEVGYDLSHRPSMRFIEPLLYNNKEYYNDSWQQLSFTEVKDHHRPFVLSSPRLAREDEVRLTIPFKDQQIDEIFQSRTLGITPQRLNELLGGFDLSADEQQRFIGYFSEEAPQKQYDAVPEGEVRIRYLGHACVLVETSEVSIITDPVLPYDIDSGIEQVAFEQMPEHIDYVLITHNHQDHILIETLLQLRFKIGTVVLPKGYGGLLHDPSVPLMFKKLGFDNLIEIDEMEELAVPGGHIQSIPFFGEHGDLLIRSKSAFLVKLHDKTVMMVADSNNIEPALYDHIARAVDDIDMIFIGMECDGAPMSWLYGPLFLKQATRKMDQSRRLDGSNAERGWSLVNKFNPKTVIVYAMGAEPWLEFISSISYTETSKPIVQSNQLIETCKANGMNAERPLGFKQYIL